MNKEIYFWIGLLVVAIIIGLGIRLYYSPQIYPVVSFNVSGVNTSVYPFQRVSIAVDVENAGSTLIKNMSVEIAVNGNATDFYRVTIPVKKMAVIYFNHTFDTPGTYSLFAEADSGRIMNVANRNAAESTVNITVMTPEGNDAFSSLPSNGLIALKVINLNPDGYITLSYLHANYSLAIFDYAPNNALSRLLLPLLNTTINYINNVSMAYGTYSNSSKVYSVWVRGYLNPSVIATAASAIGMNSSTSAISGINTTVIHSENSTICGWYSGGWIKLVSYAGYGDCAGFVSNNDTIILHPENNSTYELYKKLNANETNIGNYSFLSNNGELLYKLSFTDGAIVASAVENSNTTTPQTCFGVVSTANNSSYCSTYILQKSGTLSNVSLVRTTLLTSHNNVSVFYLVNESKALSFIPMSIGMISVLNISHSIPFTSGFSNVCSFNSSFACSNPNFANGTLSFNVTSLLKNASRITGAYCFQYTKGKQSVLNATVAYGKSSNLKVTCYNANNIITGIPLNLRLKLELNYTVNGRQTETNGTAVIYGFSG